MNFPLNVNCQILIFLDLRTMIKSRSGRYIAVFMLLSTTRNNEVQRVQFESYDVDENCWEMAICSKKIAHDVFIELLNAIEVYNLKL